MDNENVALPEELIDAATEEAPEGNAESTPFPIGSPTDDSRAEEISEIKRRLDAIDGRKDFVCELKDLLALVPDADIRRLDEQALDDIADGKNITFSYLLSEKRREQAERENRKNALSSTGEVRGGGDSLFSLDEIRSMDRKSVRRNLDKVMRSLEASATK